VIPEVIIFLPQLGADIHAVDRYGRNAVHLATNREKVIILHALGVDINATDCDGKTPLDYSDDRPDVATSLMSLGAIHGRKFVRPCILQ
jgi:ankyrin repeat protein